MMRAASNSMLMPTAAPPGPAYWGLTFTAEEAGSTIAMNTSGPAVSLETSTDGETWTPFIIGTTTITLAKVGDRVFFRAGDGGTGGDGINIKFGQSAYIGHSFIMTGRIAASGDISSILDRSGTVLSFAAQGALPARTYAFFRLFRSCTSLTRAPELPATVLAQYCYGEMFRNCSSLTTPPDLPATTLETHCYRYMFAGNPSLTRAPELPATTLVTQAYYYMFWRCTALADITVALQTWGTASKALSNWVNGVAASGTFRCPAALGTDETIARGTDRCPAGWTVINI